MISFENVTKTYKTHQGFKTIVERLTCRFPAGHNLGILGMNGVGKSTLLRMIAGAEPPDCGRVRRNARISFPVGFGGTFHPHLTGRQNATFMARVYRENVRRVVDFVGDFSELGAYFDMPIQTYSSGMHAKFAFAVSLAIEFDVYLVDEVTEVGDARFRQKCAAIFRERMLRSDIIMVSHNSQTIRSYCDVGAVLSDGRLTFYNSIHDAMFDYHRKTEMTHA